MKMYSDLSQEELRAIHEELKSEYEKAKAEGLSLDMSRGKPSPLQLDAEKDFTFTLDGVTDFTTKSGQDCRNYGTLLGIPEARKLVGDMLGVAADNVIVFGNSSLNIMYDTVMRAEMFGVLGSTPWCRLERVKFLCPVPGYDRHFAITEQFGIEMINVPMTDKGPDMDIVERYVKDKDVKGIWCVPKYSNPQGYTYSDDTVRRLASLRPAAEDFRIFWDNAYCIHDIYEDRSDSLLEILSECEKAGNPDMVYEFCSTSKVTFPGSGIAALATSRANVESISKLLSVQTIGHDKINMLRHVEYFKDVEGLKAHMRRHAEFLRPKFELINEVLTKEIGELGIGTWTNPNGGYFVSFDSIPGCAKEIIAKCKEAGVTMTEAGATFPYHKDPLDCNIRIAPSYPSLEEIDKAIKLFVLCVKLVSSEKFLEKGW